MLKPSIRILVLLPILFLPSESEAAEGPKLRKAGLAAFQLETADGRVRDYYVHLPKRYRRAKRYPVVLVLHGGGGNAVDTAINTRMNELADAEGFIAIYPEGIGKRTLGKQLATWNGGICCGEAMEKEVDDVAFFEALLGRLENQFSIDTSRIYATGISNGALMSQNLACELSGRIAAVAPIAGPGKSLDCDGSTPVPILIIHGTEDRCARWEGGERCGGCFVAAIRQALGVGVKRANPGHFPCQSVVEQVAFWRRTNGCGDEVRVFFEEGGARCESYGPCSGAPVALCAIEGGGHTWPGTERGCEPGSPMCAAYIDVTGSISRDLDANRVMWDFFSENPRARRGN